MKRTVSSLLIQSEKGFDELEMTRGLNPVMVSTTTSSGIGIRFGPLSCGRELKKTLSAIPVR